MAPPPPPPPSPTTVPLSYFGETIHDAIRGTPWPSAPFGTVRVFATHTSWAEVNTAKGYNDWSQLDAYINLAVSKGVDIMYTVALTPLWATAARGKCAFTAGMCDPPDNIADYQNFVTQLVTRYKGKIKYYEGWNEANLNGQFWNGSVAQLIQTQKILYKTVHQIDPAALVLSPAVTSGDAGYLDQEFAAGLQGNFDIVAFHFYTWPQAPEPLTTGMLRDYKAVLAKYGVTAPIWNTEQGWNIPAQISPATAAAFVSRAFLIDWSLGLARYYFYAWDDNEMGIQGTVAATAVGEVTKWMWGADMPPCSQSGSVYTCAITRPGGYQGWIVWNTSTSSTYTVPAGVRTVRRLDGTSSNASGTVTIDGTPILLQNQ